METGLERRSFTVERFFSDIAQYHRFTGVEFNGLTLSVAPNAMVTGALTMIGQGMATGTSIIAGATYSVPTSVTPFDSFSGAIDVGGSASAVVTSVELSLENGLEALFVVGSDESLQPAIGMCNLTGSMSVYFEDSSMIDRFISETETELSFTLIGDGGSYKFIMPRIKFGSGAPEVSGTGPVVLTMDFQALYDDFSGTNLKIVRTKTA